MIGSAYYDSRFPGTSDSSTIRVTSPPELKGVKLLILWGGEDISPSLYQQKAVRAYAPDVPSTRDKIEVNLAKAAMKMGIPILGVCRGAQLMCALGGGSLYQHVNNHGGHHPIIYKGQEIITNSAHHQMMIPTEDMQVLAATPCRSPYKWLDQDDPIEAKDDEPEIVYMPNQKAIGVQGHPEWMGPDSPLVKLVRELTGELLHVEI